MSDARVTAQHILFTGTPGTRKSTQALSYPKPQYWFSWDKKMESLILPMKAWKIDPKLISYDNYFDWDSAAIKLQSFLLTCPYKTIILDSVTSLADCALAQVKGKKGGDAKKVGGISVNSIEDYNAESSALMESISLTKQIQKNLGVNIILIAHLIQAEYKSNPAAAANVVRTIVTAGKRVAPKIPAYADESYYFYLQPSMVQGQETYSCLTSSTTEDFARTQLELPKVIEFGNEPLYDKWIKPAIDKINTSQLPI